MRDYGARAQRLTDYVATIDAWSAVFSPQQIFVGFLEDVHFSPRPLLEQLYGFLGVDVPERQPAAEHVVHSGSISTIPATIARALEALHRDLVDELARRLGGHALWWQYCAQRLRDGYGDDDDLVYPLWDSSLWKDWTCHSAGTSDARPTMASRRLSSFRVS